MKFKKVLATIFSCFAVLNGVTGGIPVGAMQAAEQTLVGGKNNCNVVFITENDKIEIDQFISKLPDITTKEEMIEYEEYLEKVKVIRHTYVKAFEDGTSINLNLSSDASDLGSADMICMCVDGCENGQVKEIQSKIENEVKSMKNRVPETTPYCLVSTTGRVFNNNGTKCSLQRLDALLKDAISVLPENTFVWKYGHTKDVEELNLCDRLADILHSNLVQKGVWSEQWRFASNFATSEGRVQTEYFQPINVLFVPVYNESNPYCVIEGLAEAFKTNYGANTQKTSDNTAQVTVAAWNASSTKRAEFVFNLRGESGAFNGLNDETRNTDAVVLCASADVCAYPITNVQSVRMQEVIPMLARNGVQLPIYLYATGYNRFHGNSLGISINELGMLFDGFRRSPNASGSIILDDENKDLAALPRRMATALVRLASQAVKRTDVRVVLPLAGAEEDGGAEIITHSVQPHVGTISDDENSGLAGSTPSSTPGWWGRRSKVEKGLIIGGSSALLVSAIFVTFSAAKKQFNKPKCDKQKVSKLSKNSLVKA